LRWVKNLNHSVWDHEVLYTVRYKKITTFNKNDFYKKQKYERERQLKVKIRISFNGDYFWNVALKKMKSGAVKDHGHI
jgi:hypothetical protein